MALKSLADDLETIFGDEVVDLELALDAGFSVEELRQTKTALNKFYKFLHSKKLITDALYHQQLSNHLKNLQDDVDAE